MTAPPIRKPSNNPSTSKKKNRPSPSKQTNCQPIQKNEFYDEPAVASMFMAAPRGVVRGWRYLTSKRGFGIVATCLSFMSIGLSIETIYVATPQVIPEAGGATFMGGQFRVDDLRADGFTEEMKMHRRFIPKPYVYDGAQIMRLNPVPTIRRAFLIDKEFLPIWVKGNGDYYWTVWDEPVLMLISILVAIVIQRFESMIWNKKSRKECLEEFNAANQEIKVAADPKAIAIAQQKARQANSYGLGGMIGTGLAIVGLYTLEFAAFVASFNKGTNFIFIVIYGGMTIFGFEVFDRLAEIPKQSTKGG